MSGTPFDHRIGRQARLLRFLRAATAVAMALATIAVLVPGSVGRAAGTAAVAALVAVPLLRVVWLAQRWYRRGDRLYGTVACGLLAIVGVAALVG